MTRPRTLAERVSAVGGVEVAGMFVRHAAPNREAFTGGYLGRWGELFPVIYLSRPAESCVEAAYRHLVDDTGVPAHLVKPRVLYRVRVEVENVLDLRTPSVRSEVGLSDADITSAVGDYADCQRVAATAHQLEYHGIIAPAATGLGETLALFRQRVSIAELPVIVDVQQWAQLPARPGSETARLTVVRD
jgi:RES domain-containing protein